MSNWLEYISTASLPIRQATLDRLRLLRDTDEATLNVADISNVVLSDPLLAFQVLRYVSSLERVRTPMTETIGIDHALMLLGIERFFKVFCDLPTIEKEVSPENMPGLATAYARARFSAWLAKEWLALNEEHRVGEYFVAALLYQVPMCCRALDAKIDPCATPDAVAKERIGRPYESVAFDLFRLSKMPERAFDLLSYSHELIDRRKLVLRTAIQLSCRFDEGWWSRDVSLQLAKVSDLTQQPADQLWRVLLNIALFLARQPQGLPEYSRFSRDLVLLPQLPVISENNFLSFDAVLDAEQSKLDLQIRETLAHLSLQLGADRLAFYEFLPGKGQLFSAYRVGFDTHDALIDAVITIKAGGIFHAFGQKTQAMRLNVAQVAAMKRRFPDEAFCQALPSSGCAMISFVLQGKFKGIFYIDNVYHAREIDDLVYKTFKDVVLRLAHT